MNVYKVILLSLYAVLALLNVSMVGKPRGPLTPGVAAVSLLISGVFAALVVLA